MTTLPGLFVYFVDVKICKSPYFYYLTLFIYLFFFAVFYICEFVKLFADTTYVIFFFSFFFSSLSSRDLLLCLRSRVTFTLPVYTWFITRGMSFPQAEQELRMTQSEFDRQAEITRLLLEGVSSTHVRTAPHRTAQPSGLHII